MVQKFKIWDGSYSYIAVSIILSKVGPCMLLKKVLKVFRGVRYLFYLKS